MEKINLKQLLTIYGRKPVLEALQNSSLSIFRLHLADSNKKQGIVKDIQDLANQRQIDVRFHNKQALSRISKNSQQDQGVALDIHMPGFIDDKNFLENNSSQLKQTAFKLIALDGITNPQNLGMIIRSVCASPMTGLLLPEKGCAKLDALVIKASAGTLFKCTIIRCKNLAESLDNFSAQQTDIFVLDGHSNNSLFDIQHNNDLSSIYVLGSETEGVSEAIKQSHQQTLGIPLQNGVESLNVAVAASLVAFHSNI